MPQSRGNIIITDGSGGVSFIPIGNNGESIMCNSAAQDKWGYYQPTSKYFAAYNSTGGTNINSGFTAITWTNEDKKDTSNYSHSANSSDVTILVAGSYKITADVTTITGLTITSTSSEAKLIVNTGSGFVDVAGTKTIIANGTVDGSGNTGTLHKVLACNAGDILRVMAQRSSGPGTVTTVANGCRIIIESL